MKIGNYTINLDTPYSRFRTKFSRRTNQVDVRVGDLSPSIHKNAAPARSLPPFAKSAPKSESELMTLAHSVNNEKIPLKNLKLSKAELNLVAPHLHYVDCRNISFKNEAEINEFLNNCSNVKHLILNSDKIKNLKKLSTTLQSLECFNCHALQDIDCGFYPNMSELKLINCHALQLLNCPGCALLKTLDCHGCHALQNLNCHTCSSLKEIKLTNCPALQRLDCSGCYYLIKLDCSNCLSLKTLNCSFCTKLNVLKLFNCGALQQLFCSNCLSLTELKLINYQALQQLTCFNCSHLTKIDCSYCRALRRLQCDGCDRLNVLQLTNCHALKLLHCSNCTGLTELELISCGALQELYCSYSGLTELKLSNHRALETLTCRECLNLGVLDCSNCPALNSLVCTSCLSLTEINLSHCRALQQFSCYKCAILQTIISSGLPNCIRVDHSDCPLLTQLPQLPAGAQVFSFNSIGFVSFEVDPNELKTHPLEVLNNLGVIILRDKRMPNIVYLHSEALDAGGLRRQLVTTLMQNEFPPEAYKTIGMLIALAALGSLPLGRSLNSGFYYALLNLEEGELNNEKKIQSLALYGVPDEEIETVDQNITLPIAWAARGFREIADPQQFRTMPLTDFVNRVAGLEVNWDNFNALYQGPENIKGYFKTFFEKNPHKVEDLVELITSARALGEEKIKIFVDETLDKKSLFSMNTCFQQVTLPSYGTYEVFEEKLLKTIEHTLGHFGKA